ncbi:MAG: DUF620 domain-containing protein [Planctomycetota bacterium]
MNGWPMTTGQIALCVKRLATGVLVLLLLAGTACAQGEDLPKAEKILHKTVDAMGGKALAAKYHNRVSTGTFGMPAQGIQGTLTSYEEAPDKSLSIIEIPGYGKNEIGTDGKIYWEREAVIGPRIMEGEERAQKRRLSTFNGLAHWEKLYKKAECVAMEIVGERPCFKLTMTPEEGAAETWYIDQNTYLMVRMDLRVISPMGVIPVQVYLENYKKVDGLMYPHTTRQRMVNIEQVITIESIKHDVKMPKDRFELPDDIKELVDSRAKDKDEKNTDKP